MILRYSLLFFNILLQSFTWSLFPAFWLFYEFVLCLFLSQGFEQKCERDRADDIEEMNMRTSKLHTMSPYVSRHVNTEDKPDLAFVLTRVAWECDRGQVAAHCGGN